MTAIIATTPEGAAIQELADVIKGCAAFQEACAMEGDPDMTLHEHVHYPLLREGVPNFWPFAVLTSIESARTRFADATSLPRGAVQLILGRKIVDPSDFEGSEIDYLNFEGAVLAEIIEKNNSGGDHFMWEVSQVEPPSRSDPRTDAEGNITSPCYYESVYSCEWSVE